MPTLRTDIERVFPLGVAAGASLSREEAQRDAVLLRRIAEGADRYHDLAAGLERDERADLDARLDRFLAEGFITFRFEERRIIVLPPGGGALERVFRRGWRQGRLIDAKELYGTTWRAGR